MARVQYIANNAVIRVDFAVFAVVAFGARASEVIDERGAGASSETWRRVTEIDLSGTGGSSITRVTGAVIPRE